MDDEKRQESEPEREREAGQEHTGQPEPDQHNPETEEDTASGGPAQ